MGIALTKRLVSLTNRLIMYLGFVGYLRFFNYLGFVCYLEFVGYLGFVGYQHRRISLIRASALDRFVQTNTCFGVFGLSRAVILSQYASLVSHALFFSKKTALRVYELLP